MIYELLIVPAVAFTYGFLGIWFWIYKSYTKLKKVGSVFKVGKANFFRLLHRFNDGNRLGDALEAEDKEEFLTHIMGDADELDHKLLILRRMNMESEARINRNEALSIEENRMEANIEREKKGSQNRSSEVSDKWAVDPKPNIIHYADGEKLVRHGSTWVMVRDASEKSGVGSSLFTPNELRIEEPEPIKDELDQRLEKSIEEAKAYYIDEIQKRMKKAGFDNENT